MSDTGPQPLAIKIKDLQLEELKITDRLVSSHQEGETLEALTKRFHKQALAVNNPTPQEIEMEVTLDKEVVPLAMVVEAPEEVGTAPETGEDLLELAVIKAETTPETGEDHLAKAVVAHQEMEEDHPEDHLMMGEETPEGVLRVHPAEAEETEVEEEEAMVVEDRPEELLETGEDLQVHQDHLALRVLRENHRIPPQKTSL